MRRTASAAPIMWRCFRCWEVRGLFGPFTDGGGFTIFHSRRRRGFGIGKSRLYQQHGWPLFCELFFECPLTYVRGSVGRLSRMAQPDVLDGELAAVDHVLQIELRL